MVTSKVDDLARVRMLVQNLNYSAPAYGIAGNKWVIEYQGWQVLRKD